ncbi:ParA family protein [Oleidesulfovibrio alaskensis]
MGARVLAVANQKGGVGKTTTTLTLAAALADKGNRVLIMDLDPHACASVHLRYYPEELVGTAYDLFSGDGQDTAALWKQIRHRHEMQPFDVVPAHIRLSELEVDLRSRKGKGTILQQALKAVEGDYDYIVLDCPPHVGILLVNAIVAADLLIIPIQTDFLALHGLKLLFDTVRVLNKAMPEPVRYKALATMYDKRAGACNRVLDLIGRKMGDNMFRSVIGIDTKFREASAQGKVIYDIDRNSRGAKAYEALAEEIATLW